MKIRHTSRPDSFIHTQHTPVDSVSETLVPEVKPTEAYTAFDVERGVLAQFAESFYKDYEASHLLQPRNRPAVVTIGPGDMATHGYMAYRDAAPGLEYLRVAFNPHEKVANMTDVQQLQTELFFVAGDMAHSLETYRTRRSDMNDVGGILLMAQFFAGGFEKKLGAGIYLFPNALFSNVEKQWCVPCVVISEHSNGTRTEKPILYPLTGHILVNMHIVSQAP